MKRRRQRHKEEMLEELRAVLSGLGAVLDLPSGDASLSDSPGDTRSDAVGGAVGSGGGGGAAGSLLSSGGDGAPVEAGGSDISGGGGSSSGSRAAAAVGGGVWGQYSPLLLDLASDWRAAGDGDGSDSGDSALEALLGRMPERLRRAMRPGQLRRALEAAAGKSDV
jgi:hypothetical protein